jgi:hypothetical protein
VKAVVRVAVNLPSRAIEVFKMQFDYSRIVEIGRKVVSGVGSPRAAHVKDGTPYFWWETINMLRIPWWVVQ